MAVRRAMQGVEDSDWALNNAIVRIRGAHLETQLLPFLDSERGLNIISYAYIIAIYHAIATMISQILLFRCIYLNGHTLKLTCMF